MRTHIILTGLCIFGLLFVAPSVHAKLFKNSYVQFELPANWDCELEGTEWVCINKFVKKNNEKREAIIILTAKEKGPSDSLTLYEGHLKTERNLVNAKGQKYKSQIKQVRPRKISMQDWMDGIHLGSEVQEYYTRYLATVKGQIAVLVTFSAHKDHYAKYAQDFMKAIQSLRIVASDDILAGSGGALRKREDDLYALPIGATLDESELGDENMYAESGGDNQTATRILIGLLLVAAGGAGFYMLQKDKFKKRG
ncbi:MAG: hypothetical protein M9899_03650 [Bdellovibrionaceae bacterium]|nr:hypothetical protein [Pseudobdellovibrionaceae bacterium]